MLCDDLDHLTALFRQHEYEGVTFTAPEARWIAGTLADAAQRAGALERLTVPRAGRLDLDPARVPRDPETAGANVLPFTPQEKPPSERWTPRHPEPAA